MIADLDKLIELQRTDTNLRRLKRSLENAETRRAEIEREFEEHLQAAAYIFQETKNGRFEGAIRACAAVVQFIKKRSAPAEYAALHCPRLAFSKPKSDMHELATRDRLLAVSHSASRSLSANSVCWAETAVPPKCANEMRAR